MSVEFITVTPNAEEIIMYCARVSNPKNQDSGNPALLKYCIKHKHWSVFETASMTVEIITSRAISSQILRHKSMNFQEHSQRYSNVQGFLTYQARRQDSKNRQNSIDDLSNEDKTWFNVAQKKIQKDSLELYNEALSRGIAKECARFLLPMSSKTKLYMTGSVRSWIHYLDVRCSNETQKEHRDIALRIRNIFIELFPNIAEALEWRLHEF